jgi:Ser/Thr protein kinase RdoA (MazF antagonist)
MIFDDKDQCLNLAEKILAHYHETLGADCRLKLLQLSENITYLVEHTNPENADSALQSECSRAVLRLCRPGYHTEKELEAEAAWMCRLHTDALTGHLMIRQVIPGDDGCFLYSAADAGGQIYFGMMFTYLSGVPLEELPLEQQPIWFERLGEMTALLHRQARAWEAAGYSAATTCLSAGEVQDRTGCPSTSGEMLPRFHWNYETMMGENGVWGDWRKVTGLLDVVHRADRMICDRLQSYGQTKENYGLIHGDLRGANLLTENGHLKIIDFDDCGYGWFMQDLAAALSFMETEEIVPDLIRSWIAGYQHQGVLTQADLEMIPTFIMMRRMQLLPWIYSRENAVSAIRYRETFVQGTVELARQYVAEEARDVKYNVLRQI